MATSTPLWMERTHELGPDRIKGCTTWLGYQKDTGLADEWDNIKDNKHNKVYYHHAVLIHSLPPNGMKLPNLEQNTQNPPKHVFDIKISKATKVYFCQKRKQFLQKTLMVV